MSGDGDGDGDGDSWEGYESGPFCRHFHDPADCDVICLNCGHKCTWHRFEDPGKCTEDGCACKEWKNSK